MIRKTPSDFTSHDEWLSYVYREIAVSDQLYALALGRLELFRSFYLTQGLPFPVPFAQEFERIEMLQDPERTAALDALNDKILGSLTKQMVDQVGPTSTEDVAHSPSPREKIRELCDHLAQRNPYFGLWVAYKRYMKDHPVAEAWREHLLQELGIESGNEAAFAHAMIELDKLLSLFHDKNSALPGLAFERILFLHALQGPERMLQTRAVLGMLTAELASCTSA